MQNLQFMNLCVIFIDSSSENDLSDLEVIDKKTSLMKNGTTSFHSNNFVL